jgi:sterol desaturase/sphingolipid hydroxylase (fatty acid hydroxylase superfamily)
VLLIHANARGRFGWLEWVFATPAFHHWHHANEGPESANKNFAGSLPFTDWIFGTLHLPKPMPHHYGIDESMPRGYVGQLVQPFRARTEETAPPATSAPASAPVVSR